VSWRVVVYGLAGGVLAAFIFGPMVGRLLRGRRPVCGHCRDDGRLIVWINGLPELRWCNFCMLGQQYEHAAARRATQEEGR